MKKLALFLPLFLSVSVFPTRSLATEKLQVHFNVPQETFSPGSIIELGLLLDAPAAVNAADIKVEFTPETLEFIGYDEKNSLITFWRQKPEISDGRIVEAEGGMVPSFMGNNGELVRLKFKVRAIGPAGFSLNQGDFFLADGKATKVSIQPFYFRVSISESGAKSQDTIKSSPVIKTYVSQLSQGAFLVIDASDAQSGIKENTTRILSLRGWTDWKPVMGGIFMPKGALLIQINSLNNQGEITRKFIWTNEAKTAFAALLLLILSILAGYLWYNKRK